MGELVNQGIAKRETASTQFFESLIKGQTFLTLEYETPKEYVNRYWCALENSHQRNLHSNVFEYIIYTLLFREGILPFYTQAKVAYVANICYDTILISHSAPISLSLRATLHNHCKWEDLEAVALRYIYRRAKSYLLTMDTREANVQKAKILSGDMMGLDAIIDCNTDDINTLVSDLKRVHFTTSVKIDAVEGNLIQ